MSGVKVVSAPSRKRGAEDEDGSSTSPQVKRQRLSSESEEQVRQGNNNATTVSSGLNQCEHGILLVMESERRIVRSSVAHG